MAPRTCQAPAGDVPAHAPLTARLCGRPATTSSTIEGVTFALCAPCARELTMTDLTDYARPGESCAAAIARAVREGRRLCSYTSPTEEAREGLTAAEAEEIAADDPGLVRVEADQARDERLARERAACDELTRLDVAVQAALVLMKNPDFPTAQQAALAIAQIVKEVDGAELLATLRRRLNPADLPSDLAQPDGLCHCGTTVQ